MSLTRGFTKWFWGIVHKHQWSPWHYVRMVTNKDMHYRVRECSICKKQQMKKFDNDEENQYWEGI